MSAKIPSAPSSAAVRTGFLASCRKWLKFPKTSTKPHQSLVSKPDKQPSSTGVQLPEPSVSPLGEASLPKPHAGDRSTEGMLEPDAPFSSSVPTSVVHTAEHTETPPPEASTHPPGPSSTNMIDHHRSSDSRPEAAPSASWVEISMDTLKRMEANQFQFNLIDMLSSCSAKVDKPEDYPEKVTTQSAPSYLMSTRPPYAAKYHFPNRDQRQKIIYYELQDIPDDWGTGGNIWFGFSRYDAKGPPGSGPGSFGINRCEGNLYYNNVRIGNSHNFEFQSGAKIGIGIVFSYVDQKSHLASNSDPAIEVRVIHTRQGVLVDDVHVDTIAAAGQDGFDGYHDLFATVGTVERVVFEVSFEKTFWDFNPKEHGF
jgi:hypothetical protein